mgnify:CR=1 FL=1
MTSTSTEKTKRGRTDFIEGTTIPKNFAKFFKAMLKISTVTNRKTVSVFADDNGPFASVYKVGTNNEMVSLFLNKSRGWRRSKKYALLRIESWHTGDIKAIVPNDVDAMKQAYKLCLEWKAAKPDYKPEITVLGQPMKKTRAKKKVKDEPRDKQV